ncbi:MAG: (2Fe-2S)-binding protein [Bacillaceae bacterium]|nr:(2Fe-2S)-binding protein [Bacillaceae bacterium]
MNTAMKENLFILEEKFRFTKEGTGPTLSSLLNGEMDSYLQTIQPYVNAPNKKVAASLLVKRLSFLAVNVLYVMSVTNKKIEINPDHIQIVSHFDGDTWLPKFRFESLRITSIEDREWERKKVLEQLFKEIFTPIINMLSKEAKVPRTTLWENVMIYIYWLYESVIPETHGDFQALLEADGSLFDMNHNVAATSYSTKKYVKPIDATVRVRKTCCFYYETNEKASHCKTCPLRCNV